MSKKIKLIWDFRGQTAQKIAEHHVMHLKEYIAIECLYFYSSFLKKKISIVQNKGSLNLD